MNKFSYILKLNKLPDFLIDEISHLQNECKKQNNADFYIYIDEDDSFYDNINNYHLYYTGDILAGFLSLFVQDETSVCISGCVLPEYQGRHIFTKLYQSSLDELSAYPELIKGMEFHLPDKDSNAYIPAIHFLNKNGLYLHHQEYLLTYDLAHMSDMLAPDKIDTDYDEQDKAFSIWLDDTYIGGCHIYYPDDSESVPDDSAEDVRQNYVTIYDYEILPEYRGNGYGKAGLLSILGDLHKSGFRQVILHVSGINKKAHSMYISCGFSVHSSFSVFSRTD